jgi:site-specific DNA recombinase
VRVCLYARVSTEEQAERYGLTSQVTELRAWAAQRGDEVVAEFLDEGASGTELHRPALARLREALRLRVMDGVLVHDPDRLARKLAHQLLLTEEIERAGVRLEYLTTPRSDTPESRLLEHIKGVVAEYEREKIKERTRRGRRAGPEGPALGTCALRISPGAPARGVASS